MWGMGRSLRPRRQVDRKRTRRQRSERHGDLLRIAGRAPVVATDRTPPLENPRAPPYSRIQWFGWAIPRKFLGYPWGSTIRPGGWHPPSGFSDFSKPPRRTRRLGQGFLGGVGNVSTPATFPATPPTPGESRHSREVRQQSYPVISREGTPSRVPAGGSGASTRD